MKRRSWMGKIRLKLSTRLTLLNVTICLGIGLIIAIQFVSYYTVEDLLREISNDHMDQVVHNAQNGRDLAKIVTDIDLLNHHFYNQDEQLKLESGRILSDMTLLSQTNRDPAIGKALDAFTVAFGTFIEHCHQVNAVLAERRASDNELHNQLEALEETVADQMITLTLAGEDTTFIEQLSLLIFGYRESLLAIGKRFAELEIAHFTDLFAGPERPILAMLGDLRLRLRTLTASDQAVQQLALDLRRGIDRYSRTMQALNAAMLSLRQARQTMRESQKRLITTMAIVDNQLAESAEQVDQVIKDQLQRTGLMVGTLALAILVGLVMASTILLVRHVRSPMAAIQTGIANFSKGRLDTPIDLNRQDEWGIIENALNHMARDLKASYAALEISEQSYRSIFENVNEGIYQTETTASGSYFTKANPALARLLAYESPQAVIQAYDDLSTQLFVDPGDRERLLATLKREKTVSGFECQLKDSNGRHLWMAISAHLTADDGDRHITLEGTMLDISTRKRAEEEMHRLRKLLKNITDSMPSALVAVDAEGCVTQWNREAERLTGTPAAEAQGRPLREVFPQIKDLETRIKDAIAQRPFEPQVTVTNLIDGKEVINDITIYPLMADGIAGAVIRLDDVTDRIRMKEMMIQSEKMLSVGGLAAGMAHEINNPLAGILQNVQVIENRLLKDLPKNHHTAANCGIDLTALGRYLEARGIPGMLSAVSDSGKRAAHIVDNMLSFARKGESVGLPNDLAALMDLTIELAENDYDLKTKLDFRHIRIVKAYDATLPPVPCNSSKIQQVLLNLLRNGAQAMAAQMTPSAAQMTPSAAQMTPAAAQIPPSAGVEVARPPQFTLRIQRAGKMARIEIEDNGIGMDEATRKRAFEPFFTTKEVGVGTGLGLSVSYFIITENHKGRMSVTSQPGKGSTFRIELPMNSHGER